VDPNAFGDWSAGSVKARYFRTRILLTPGLTPGYVTAWTPTISKNPDTQTSAGPIGIAAGGSPITFARPYHNTPAITVTAQGANVAWFTGASGTGFTEHVGPDTTHDNCGTGTWTAVGV